MEHACAKCGKAVEDGIPFCPSCGAPQIRVSGLVNRPSTPPFAASVEQIQAPVEGANVQAPGSVLSKAAGLDWAQVIRSAVLAGLLLAIALVVPRASPLLLMLAAGGLAVALYARRCSGSLTRKLGARVGMLSGLMGWAVLALVLLGEVVFGGGRLIAALRDALQQQIAANPDPNLREIAGRLAASPSGLAAVIVFGMLLFLILLLICGALGGAIGAWLLGKPREKNQP